MVYQGKTISVALDDDQLAVMTFNAETESINKFDLATIEELRSAVSHLATLSHVRGMLIQSAKESFIVGADIRQFHALFANDESAIEAAVIDFNQVFCQLEDLPFPTVCLIDGIALGGGLELALSADFRVASPKARLGLPEVKLGINPGFGGTVRLPRVIGIDNAIEWIATGKEYNAQAAFDVGVVDAVVSSEALRAAGLHLIEQANAQKISYKQRRKEKTSPVLLNDMERIMAFTTAKGLVASQAGPHMPAPLTSVKSIEKSASLHREEALAVEARYFSRLAKTEVAGNLIALFLNEQDLSKRSGKLAAIGSEAQRVAVVGAGIMGGGIAYQAAYKGKHAVMKDIAQVGLDQGMQEATKLLSKQVERGRMSAADMAATVGRITPSLHYAEFADAQVAIEAVVENLKVKQAVLAEVEQQMAADAVITSNTSTLSITAMAESLQYPERFCGMHFFNPVHRMPLVEVIRGAKTSDKTIATVVKLAKEMGKTPIVVNDCPGFYVNRVLFPYLAAFNLLVRDGADYPRIDKVMEKFGWPMGPAYLIDVVGLDTASHAASVMAEGFPDRMASNETTALELLFKAGRLGQKNGKGFYAYEMDKKGKPKKSLDNSVEAIIQPAIKGSQAFSDEEIIERMMIPMCLEVVRCLDEKIVSCAIDADMGLLMGIGFPLFRGGPLRYLESIGIQNFLDMTNKYQHLGELYREPVSLLAMAEQGKSFFAQEENA